MYRKGVFMEGINLCTGQVKFSSKNQIICQFSQGQLSKSPWKVGYLSAKDLENR
jgi:hypothetical protein